MPLDPSTLQIVTFPAPILRDKSHEIESVTDEVRQVAQRMIELMVEAPGVGLAANQVGLDWRLFVAHVEPDPEGDESRSLESDPISATPRPQVYINPRLSDYKRDLVPYAEGCLSLPGIEGEVRRPSEVTVSALDLDGNRFTQRAGGLLARVWQHECDHLDGVLIIDRMLQSDRKRHEKALRELQASGMPG